MKSVTITKLKDELSALLDQVKAGQVIIIFDRNTPIAKLVRADAEEDPANLSGRLLRLERSGLVRRGKRLKKKSILLTPPPKLPPGVSVVQAILEERDSKR